MPVTRRGNSWLVAVGSGSNRFRQSFKDEAVAKAVHDAESSKRSRSLYPDAPTLPLTPRPSAAPVAPTALVEPSTVTFGYVFKIAKATKWRETGRATLKNARLVLDVLGERTPVAAFTQEKFRNLLIHFAEMGNSGATINRKLSALSVMLKLAVKEGWLDKMPVIERERESHHRVGFYTEAEEKQMLAICERRGYTCLADFIAFGIDTGFRRMEILDLPYGNATGGWAFLSADMTKSKKPRKVPLTSRARAIVEGRKGNEGKKLFEGLTDSILRTQWDVLQADMKRSEDAEFIVHTLRHTCGTRLALAGKSAPFIMAWLGHSSLSVTQRYITIAGAGLEEGVAALESFSGK